MYKVLPRGSRGIGQGLVALLLLGVSLFSGGPAQAQAPPSGVETPYSWETPNPIVEVPDGPAAARNVRMDRNNSGLWMAVYHNGLPRADLTTPSLNSSLLWTSSIDGSTWSDPVTMPDIPGAETSYNFRPEVKTDGFTSWVTIFDGIGPNGQDVFVTRSFDAGSSWSPPAAVGSQITPDNSRPRSASIETDGLGTWVAAWIANQDDGTTSVIIARSPDLGASWTLVDRISNTGTGRPQVKTDRNGTWVVTYEQRAANSNSMYWATNDLNSSSTYVKAPINSDFATDARNDAVARLDFAAGTWVAVWGSQSTTNQANFRVNSARALGSSFTPPSGFTWSPVRLITNAVNFGSAANADPWIATDAHNNWITVWSSQNNQDPAVPRDIFTATSYNDGTTWTAVQSINNDFASQNVTRFAAPVIDTDNTGNWLTMWTNNPAPAGQQDSGLTTVVPWYANTFLPLDGQFLDLQVTGTVITPAPIWASTDFEAEWTITNAGPLTATNISVEIRPSVSLSTPPPGLIEVKSVTGSTGWNDASVQFFIRGTINSLAPGQSVTVRAVLNADTPGVYQSEADAEPAEFDPAPANNIMVRVPITIVDPPAIVDLSITKTAFPFPNVEVGKNFSYIITVRNLDPQTAAPGVVVTDLLPLGTEFLFANASQGSWAVTTTNNRKLLTVNFGRIGASGRATLTIGVKPVNGYTSVTNSASVTLGGVDPNPSNNTSSVTVNYTGGTPGTSDIAVSKQANANPANQGTSMTYTLTAVNNGPGTAQNVVMTDVLPASLYYLEESHTRGTVTRSGNTVTASVGTLQAGESATVLISVIPLSSGTINNTVTGSTTSPDGNNANNSATLGITVNAVDPSEVADVSVTETAYPSPATVGESLVYYLHIENAGQAEATNVVVVDQLPDSVVFESSVPTESSYSNGRVTYLIPSLAASSSADIQITVTPLLAGTITNVVTATADQPDLTPANNRASLDVVVEGDGSALTNADLGLLAEAFPQPATVGQPIYFNIYAYNAGPQPATNITVTHTIPTTCTLVSATGPNGPLSVAGKTITANIPFLAVNGVVPLNIAMTPQISGDLSLTAGIAGSVIDNVANNNDVTINLAVEGVPVFDLKGAFIKFKVSAGKKLPILYKVNANFSLKNDRTALLLAAPVHFYLSDDATFNPGTDTFISATTLVKVKPGKTKKKSVKFTTSENPSGKYLIAVVNPLEVPYNAIALQLP